RGEQAGRDLADAAPQLRQAVLDPRRARVEHAPLEDPGLLQLHEARRERARRDRLQCLLELVEADGARLRGCPQDREHPAPPEEVRRTGDPLRQRLAVPTPHGAYTAWSLELLGSSARS